MNHFDYGDDWLGCGVPQHNRDCLCDVVIPERNETWISDAVNDMYMGPQICELRGYSIPWTSSQFVNYLDDLKKFNDELAKSLIMDDTPLFTPNDTSRVSMEKVRNTVMQHMNQENPDIEKVLNLLGISGQVFMCAITTNRIPAEKLAKWDTALLGEFQRDLEINTGHNEMIRKYELSKHSIYNLKRYFTRVLHKGKGMYVSVNPDDMTAAREQARELIKLGMNNKQIINHVFAKYRVHYSSSAISKLRSRSSDIPN